MQRFKLFIPLFIFIILALFLLNGLERDPNAMPSALINRPVPEFSLPVLGDEESVVTQSVFKGQPALLNVWATWCISCRVEHPYLNYLSEQGIRIIGLNYKDDLTEANKWLSEKGGVKEISSINKVKAELLYRYIDESEFYFNNVASNVRSLMNVPFWLKDESLNSEFLEQAKAAGLMALKGHRMVDGMRASIYNAMPVEGVQKLVDFMQQFEKGMR